MLDIKNIRPPLIRAFILLDLILATIAIFYDWQDIMRLPLWSVPIIAICPITPLLMAAAWTSVFYHKKHAIISLAKQIGLTYVVLAPLFYITVMIHQGFDWFSLGNILWVELYASQAVAFTHIQATKLSQIISSVIVCLILLMHALTKSYGYIATDALSSFELVVLGAISISVVYYISFQHEPTIA